MTALLWALPALPLAAGALLAALGRRADRLAPPTAVAVAALALADAGLVAAGRPRVAAPFLAGLPAGLGVDALSAVMVVTVTAVTLAVLLYSAGELGPEEARARFFGLMLIFAGAMLVTVTATTLVTLLMAWEVMGATSYALIGYWWREPRRVRAGNVAFLTTRGADLGLYLAAGAALTGAGSLGLDRLAGLPRPWLHLAAAGVVAAALGKSAQLPFSFWLSRAMEGPSPVSALLHSATMVAAGAYLLLRLQPLLAAAGWAGPAVAWAGAATAVALGAVAVAQRDLKQLLAASTAAQLGFMVLAAGAGAVAGGTAQLVAHAATKSLLFLAAGAFLTALGTKDLAGLRGAGRRYRLVGTAFAIGALALAGIAPLSLWVTKDAVLAAALQRAPGLYATGLAAAVLSALYAGRALAFVLAPVPAGAEDGYDTERHGTRRVSAAMAAPLLPLAAAAATLGLLVGPLRRTLPGPAGPQGWELATSAVLALAGLGLALRWPDPAAALPAALARRLARWLDLEAAARLLVARPTLALAHALARFDDQVLDAGVLGVARAGGALARLADRRVEPRIDGLVEGVAAGGRRLGRLARRPQTGQLHQYYAQALIGLGVLVIVLLVVR
jgi:NADH-quinone oxidoreductase subunit L